MEKKKYNYHDPAIVKDITVKAWKTPSGRIFLDEVTARRFTATHYNCRVCGEEVQGRGTCSACDEKARIDRYLKLPAEPWDEKSPVCTLWGDEWFHSKESLFDHMELTGKTVEQLCLVHSKPQYMHQVEDDYWEELLPPGQSLDECVDDKVIEALNKLNEAIGDNKTFISWINTEVRVELEGKNPNG